MMHAVPSPMARVLPTATAAAGEHVPPFSPGQALTGRVIRVLPAGRALVNCAGQTLLLALDQPVTQGQTLHATVVQVSPSLVLQLAPGAASPSADPSLPAAPAVRLQSPLGSQQAFGPRLKALEEHLASSSLLRQQAPALLERLMQSLSLVLPRGETRPDADRLALQGQRSGLNYEAHVARMLAGEEHLRAAVMADLKGQLLELQHALQALMAGRAGTFPLLPTHAREVAGLLHQVHQAVQHIEMQQLAPLLALQNQQPLLLPVLVAALPMAQLYVRDENRQRRTGQRERPDFSLVLLLHMSTFGALRLDAHLQGTRLTATIGVAAPAVADYVTAHIPTLVARLHELGFQAEVSCCVQDPVPLHVAPPLTPVPVSARLVDIRA